ncbi:MAG TPA: VIT domain-containing protein [Pyrinomonadaceae bacterium]|jgi:hypothetical protein
MQQQVQGVPGGPVRPLRGKSLALGFIMFGGIVLPAVSILIETTSHLCAETFFDPIPTTWHVVMVVFVPLAHLQVWLAVHKGSTERPVLLGLANAAALGVSLFYTIIYLPLLPLAFAALILAGLGVLPMAPLFSLVSAVLLRRELRRIAPPSNAVKWRGLIAGLALSLAAVVLAELPIAMTRVGLQMASHHSQPERRARGLRLLRDYGNQDYLLRACYERVGQADLASFLFSLRDPVTPDEAREVYYRLTGETFDTSRPPKRLKGELRPEDAFDFDPDQGGERIAGKARGLSLSGSLMDGSVDADAAVGYVEWTLTFKNVSDAQREVRAQVQLPPGGVVSRLTLWVNGEPREAAFAGRDRTRAAYQEVVHVERRDPVLVTTSGRDRVLVQAYPVPPRGGELKLRFGVSAPLVLEDRSRALLRLPHFLDRNFGIPEEVKHSVWVESKRPLRAESNRMRAERPAENLYALRGAYGDAELSDPANVVRSERDAGVAESWTRDPSRPGEVIRQFIREGETPVPSRVVLVVDTSRSMKEHGAEIIAALKSLPPNVETELILADGNGAYEEGFSQHAASGGAGEIARLLETVSFEGGADNVPALTKAWEVAAERPGGVVVWVHGPQGLRLWPVEELRRVIERRAAGGPTLYAVQAANGADRIEEGLDGVGSVKAVPRLGRLRSDLERLFTQLSGRSRALEFIRVSEKLARAADSPNGKETSSHLARLWANDEVARLITSQEKDANEKAVRVAAQYQLVTPISGAVVLETAQQYERAGLQPVEAGTVPTIPEPEMVLLVAVVAAILLFMFYRQRRCGARGSV